MRIAGAGILMYVHTFKNVDGKKTAEFSGKD